MTAVVLMVQEGWTIDRGLILFDPALLETHEHGQNLELRNLIRGGANYKSTFSATKTLFARPSGNMVVRGRGRVEDVDRYLSADMSGGNHEWLRSLQTRPQQRLRDRDSRMIFFFLLLTNSRRQSRVGLRRKPHWGHRRVRIMPLHPVYQPLETKTCSAVHYLLPTNIIQDYFIPAQSSSLPEESPHHISQPCQTQERTFSRERAHHRRHVNQRFGRLGARPGSGCQ